MIKIGEYNELIIKRDTSVGLYLGFETDENDILLPDKYCPNEFQIGDTLNVFVHLDQKERPVATTINPLITLNHFAVLEVNFTNEFGAFLNWGLEKDIFVPFKEQIIPMEKGRKYLVFLYLDKKTNRLVASSKVNQFLSNTDISLEKNDEVEIIISHFTDMGINVIVNEKHKGLIYENEIFQNNLRIGDRLKAYIKAIRPENKIDISLEKQGHLSIEPNSEKLLVELKKNNGFLALNDHSNPEIIKIQLQMSKKNFKKAVGNLYKEKIISIEKDGIRLV